MSKKIKQFIRHSKPKADSFPLTKYEVTFSQTRESQVFTIMNQSFYSKDVFLLINGVSHPVSSHNGKTKFERKAELKIEDLTVCSRGFKGFFQRLGLISPLRYSKVIPENFEVEFYVYSHPYKNLSDLSEEEISDLMSKS